MMRRVWMLVAIGVMALMLVGMAFAQGPVLLRYQWLADDEITWAVDQELAGEVVVDNLLLDPPGRVRSEVTATAMMPQNQIVETVDDDGNATVRSETGVIEIDMTTGEMGAQHMTIDMAGGKLTAAGQELPLPPGMEKMAAPIRQTISSRGELLDAQMPLDPAEMFNLGATGPLQALNMLKHANMIFPEQEIGEGYCWVQTADLTPTVPEGEEPPENPPTITYSMSYLLAGFEDIDGVQCARLEMVGALELSNLSGIPMPGIAGDATASMGPAHFSISGAIWFDHAAGRVFKLEALTLIDMVQEVEGTLTVGEKTQDVHSRTTMTGFKVHTAMERIQEG